MKVAWNGFPSLERAKAFEFKYPVLYVVGDRFSKRICICVFEVEDLKSLKKEMGDAMWWIPKRGTNPRGFGIEKHAIERLLEKSKTKGNYVTKNYSPVDMTKVAKEYETSITTC